MSRKLPNYLRTYRKRFDLSQGDVAFLLGVKSGAKVSRNETFKCVLDLQTALAFQVLFDIPVAELFAGIYEQVEKETSERARILVHKMQNMASERSASRKADLLRTIASTLDIESRRHSSENNQRVMGISPCPKGFGFAVLEGPETLVDYAVKEVMGDRDRTCLKKIADLIECYQPDVIVLENPKGKGSRRFLRIQNLIQEIMKLAASEGLKARSFSQSEIKKAFSSSGTKHHIATSLTKQFPELALRLPPARKPWMSEYERMGIFDAVALALILYLGMPN